MLALLFALTPIWAQAPAGSAPSRPVEGVPGASIRLIDSEGQPVPGAQTWIIPKPSQGSLRCPWDPIPWIQEHGVFGVSDAQGQVQLATAADAAYVYSETEELVSTLISAGTHHSLEPSQALEVDALGRTWVRMIPKRSTRITLQTSGGDPVVGAQVRLLPHSTDGHVLGPRARSAITDEQGMAHLTLAGPVYVADRGRFGHSNISIARAGRKQVYRIPIGRNSRVTLGDEWSSPGADPQAQQPGTRRITALLLSPFGTPHPGGRLYALDGDTLGVPIDSNGLAEWDWPLRKQGVDSVLWSRISGTPVHWPYRLEAQDPARHWQGRLTPEPYPRTPVIRGSVQTPEGFPLTGATVRFLAPRSSRVWQRPCEVQTSTDHLGRFALYPGAPLEQARLSATHPQGRTRIIDLPPEGQHCRIDLEPRLSLELSIQRDDWVPTDNLVAVLEGPRHATRQASEDRPRPTRQRRALGPGPLRWSGLDPGTYRFGITALGAKGWVVELPSFELEDDLRLDPIDLRGALEALAVTPRSHTGQPLNQATVRVSARGQADLGSAERAFPFVLEPGRPLTLATPKGQALRMELQAPGHAARVLDLRPGEQPQLARAFRLTLHFPHPPQAPGGEPGYTIALRRPTRPGRGRSLFFPQTPADSPGILHFELPHAGPWLPTYVRNEAAPLELFPIAGPDGDPDFPNPWLTLQPGSNDITLTQPFPPGALPTVRHVPELR